MAIDYIKVMEKQYPDSVERQRRPMPAFRDPAIRRREIAHLVGILYKRSPTLFDNIERLTSPPPIDHRALAEGYGPYGNDFARNVWNHLAADVVATSDEIRNALTALEDFVPDQS
jgi:hypothetical protein